jgi:hypothetical protein
VPVTISSAAIAADSQLSNFKSYDLKVTVSSGDNWAGAEMHASLSSGKFYLASLHDFDTDKAQPSQYSAHPNLQFDTYITGASNNNTKALAIDNFSSTRIDIVWGQLPANSGAGTWTVARLTIQNGSSGSVTGRVTHTANPTENLSINSSLPPGGIISTGGTINGKVFNDANGNGALDSGEAGISGRTVWVDADNDKVVDTNEKRATTDSSGNYSLTNVTAGSWVVRTVVPSGWTQTLPSGGFGIHATVSNGQTLNNQNFGTKSTSTTSGASISGIVFNDANGNGAKDSSEAGISGRTVWIDIDNDKVVDSTEPKATTDSAGNYKISNLAGGSYIVRTVVPSGWTQTLPSGGFGIHATVSSTQNLTNQNFGTKSTSTATASVAGNVFHDFNRNGSKDSGDSNLSGWTVWVDYDNDKVKDSNEPSATTDSNGNYKISGLAAGSYIVRVVLQSGWVQTLPSGGFGFHATVTSGQNLSGANFGVDN